MPKSGYTGISYPFRIGEKGGVEMSTTSYDDVTHIAESIQQIFGTEYLERPMEGGEVYSSISSLLFEPDDISLQQLLKSRMIDDLDRLEKRIKCTEEDIEFVIEVEDDIEILYVNLDYKVTKYNTYYTSKIRLGEIRHE